MRTKQWCFIGYDKKLPREDGGYNFSEVVEIKIYGVRDGKAALKAAKKLVKKKGYYLREVSEYEKFGKTAVLKKQDELFDKLIKLLKTAK